MSAEGTRSPNRACLLSKFVRYRALQVFPAQGCHISLHIGGFKTVDEDKQEKLTDIFPKMFYVPFFTPFHH